MTRALPLLAVVVVLAGCVTTARPEQRLAAAPVFDPATFFAGATEGRGTLKVAFKHAQPTLVEGRGRREADDAITLDQTVRRGDDAPTHRTWHLHRVGPGHWAGTLSDAAGPVSGDVEGNRLHLAFAMKGGLQAQQWLYLHPDARTVTNVMLIRKLGVPVARLDEVITRRGP